jgi:hypothetical protein
MENGHVTVVGSETKHKILVGLHPTNNLFMYHHPQIMAQLYPKALSLQLMLQGTMLIYYCS